MGEPATWRLLRRASLGWSFIYLLRAVDMRVDADGRVVALPQDQAVFRAVFARTFGIAGLVTAVTLAAMGVHFGRVPGRRAVIAVVLAPVVAPSVITGLAMYLAFAPLGLTSSMTGLVVAHTVLFAPYGFTAVLAGLQGFEPVLLRAARGLGARPAEAV